MMRFWRTAKTQELGPARDRLEQFLSVGPAEKLKPSHILNILLEDDIEKIVNLLRRGEPHWIGVDCDFEGKLEV